MEKLSNIESIDPKYWGKSGWIFLNSIALTYKPEYKDAYKTFLYQLPHILPCTKCGYNLKKRINELDDALISREKLLTWLLNIRNDVQNENKREIRTINHNINEIFTVDDVHPISGINWSILITCLVILILLFILLKQKN